MKKKIILFLIVFVSNCFSQYIPQFLTQPPVGYQINLSSRHKFIGLWLFHEGSGNTVYDLSPNGNEGTFTNMVSSTDWVTGESGYAVNFDGVDAFIDFGSATSIDDAEPWTIFWKMYLNNVASSDLYISKGLLGASGFWRILCSSGSNARLRFEKDQVGGDPEFSWDQSLTANEWHTYSLSWPGGAGAMELYLDGILFPLTSGVGAGTFRTDAAESLTVGDASTGLDGRIDYIFWIKGVLTSSEQLQLYINPFSMFEQPPGRILAVAAAAAAVDRRRLIIANP